MMPQDWERGKHTMQVKRAIIHECFEPGMRGSLVALNQLGVQLLRGQSISYAQYYSVNYKAMLIFIAASLYRVLFCMLFSL